MNWKIRDIEESGPKKNTYGGPSADQSNTARRRGKPLPEPRQGRRIDHHLSHDEIMGMSYQQMLDSGRGGAPTAETMRENPHGQRFLSNSRRRNPGTHTRREFAPLFYIVLFVLLIVFVCWPVVQILLTAS